MAPGLPQQVVRSSSRIPEEIPILLIGSDLDGKVFSESTSTVLLSLHGAGIVSHHKLSPEQELILRCPDRNTEAEIRVVGQLGSQHGIYTYGVAFVDPSLKFWDIDFPPLSSAELERGLLLLVCNSCKTLERIDETGIEADICSTSGGVLRFCQCCGTTTFWKPVQPQSLPAVRHESLPLAAPPASSPAPAAPALPPALALSLPPAPLPADLPPPPEPDAPRANRRKHERVKVSYSACVRHAERGDDVVTCEDMSRGGLRFKSHKRYYDRTLIDVAVPYTPGQPSIFVPAQIVFFQELPEQQLFRYGVAYLQLPKASNHV